MRKSIKNILLLAGCLVIQFSIFAQTRQELEKQRMTIIKDIEKTTKALESTKKNKEKNLTQLKAIEQQVDSRKKLINNLQTEVKVNENLINQNETKIQELRRKHEKLKTQYAAILRSSYLKKMSHSKWSYLLSSDNLNNLLIRWRYIHQFDNYTKQKLEEIQRITGQIQEKNMEISKTKEKNLNVLKETSNNMLILEKEQKQKDAIVKKLSKEETKLASNLEKREKERENLNRSIEKIIIAELAKSKAKEKDDVAVIKKKEIDNSGFSKNRGALNWPVNNATITGRFGTHPHPSIKNVDVSNNGVDFTMTSPGEVECVYDGEVVGVTNIVGFKNMVIIKHGSYYSVYSKLDDVVVSKGQKIKRGQSIGVVSGKNDDNKYEMHFELWKDKSKLDPQRWFNR